MPFARRSLVAVIRSHGLSSSLMPRTVVTWSHTRACCASSSERVTIGPRTVCSIWLPASAVAGAALDVVAGADEYHLGNHARGRCPQQEANRLRDVLRPDHFLRRDLPLREVG